MQQQLSNTQKSLDQHCDSSGAPQINQNIQQTLTRETYSNQMPLRVGIGSQIVNKPQHKGENSDLNKFQKANQITSNKAASINELKNQIMSKIFQHNRNITTQQSPPLEQISKCAQMLQQQFPKMKVQEMLRVLQDLLVNNCKIQQSIQEQSFNSASEEYLDHQLNRNDYSKANALVRERAAVHVPPGARLSQQKKIAISYLNHGYGIRILRQYIKDPSISSTRYNNVITTIMKLAFRRLEEHIKAMGRPVVPVNSQDEKVIRAPLTNCQKWLPPEELESFYKFIKLACCLEQKVDINSASAIKLYDLCIRQLRQRQTNEQNNKSQKILRGSHRLPRIAQSMYNLIGNYNLQQVIDSFQGSDRMFYGGQSTKMHVGPKMFHVNNIQRKRLDPPFQNFQKFNVQPMKMTFNKWKPYNSNSSP